MCVLDHLALRCIKSICYGFLRRVSNVSWCTLTRNDTGKWKQQHTINENMSISTDKAALNYNLCFSDGDGGSCSGGGGGSSPVFHLPADFFHPAAAAHPGSPGNSVSPGDRGPSRLASPASWASLRSPGANSRPLSSQVWMDSCVSW